MIGSDTALSAAAIAPQTANAAVQGSMLITGVTSGIGQQLCLDYLQQGWLVYGVGRQQTVLTQLAQHSNFRPLRLDVTDYAACKQLLVDLPPLQKVICNAGICEYIDGQQFDALLFQRVWQTNVQGVANCLEFLIPKLLPDSQLVLVDSLARLLPFTKASAYGSSKAALHYLANSLAVDLVPRQIKVVTVSPGFVATPLTATNSFKMPQLVTVQQASAAIRQQLQQHRIAVYFPWRLSALLRFCQYLPLRWQRAIARRLV